MGIHIRVWRHVKTMNSIIKTLCCNVASDTHSHIHSGEQKEKEFTSITIENSFHNRFYLAIGSGLFHHQIVFLVWKWYKFSYESCMCYFWAQITKLRRVRFTHTNVINTFPHAHLLRGGQRSGYHTVTNAHIWWAQFSQLELATLLSCVIFDILCLPVYVWYNILYVSLKWIHLKPTQIFHCLVFNYACR